MTFANHGPQMAVLLILGIMLSGCGQKDDQTAVEFRPVRSLVAAARTDEDFITLSGDIHARHESDLGFKISGRLLSRTVELGTMVHKGDLLARLDEQDEHNQMVAAQASLTSAKAQLAQASAERDRLHRLLADGFATASNYDIAQRVFLMAQASVQGAEADLRRAQDRIGYAELRAPEDGAITALGADAGQVVAAGQMVVRLAQLDEKDAVFALAEEAMPQLPHDPAVEVSLLGTPSIVTSGRVRDIAASADAATRTYTVKVALPQAPDVMRLGMTVVGKIRMTDGRVFALPGSALLQQNGRPVVWRLMRPESGDLPDHLPPNTGDLVKVVAVPVTIQRFDGDQVLISQGLEDGQRVVTAGVQKLRPGQIVRYTGEGDHP